MKPSDPRTQRVHSLEYVSQKIIHFVLWKKNKKTGKYPVYLCNQAIIPHGKLVVSDKLAADKVTCKNCQRMLR